MPSARISSANMSSQLVRDAYQANGLTRSHQQSSMATSQTSLQKLPASSPQFLYQFTNNNHQQQQQQSMMQFPPPPQQPQIAQQSLINKSDPLAQYNQMMVPNQLQQQQQQQNLALNNLALNNMLSQQSLNGINGGITNNNGHGSMSSSNSNLTQSTILMSAPLTNSTKNLYQQHQSQAQQQALYNPSYLQQQHHHHQQQQQQQQQQTQQILAGNQQLNGQQQVPMTTVMIPTSTASQLQNVAMQIQQAAMQSSPNLQQNPQILVFMIPYMVNPAQVAPYMAPVTPEQASLNSTLIRQSNSNSSMMRQSHPQVQQQAPQTSSVSQSRAVSSLSNRTLTPKQEPEKFYIKANFSYQPTRNRQELSFQKGDILHVLDTLQNNDYGVQYWLATRVKPNGEDAEKGLIPNKIKAEEITIEQRTMDIGERAGGTLDNSPSNNGTGGVLSASVGRVNFLKRRSAQRSKSLCKDNWDNVVFDIGNFRVQTYERVVFKHPGFCRPVVIFGPLSDLAREKLLKDYPEKYSYPSGTSQAPDHPKLIRLKGILDVIDQGKHALLDITAQAVERLNYANLAPIVIFMKTESKSIIKEFRSRAAKSIDPNTRDEDTLRRDGKSSRKLLEQSVKLEKQWCHVFTAILDLSSMGSEMWYRKLRETIESQQSSNVWMGEKKSEKKLAAAAGAAAASSSSITATNSKNSNNMTIYSGHGNSRTNLSNGVNLGDQQPTTTSRGVIDSSSVLSEKLNECLNISSTKSTNDLQQNLTPADSGLYGNRSQLRNAYAHSLAQRLARASSEPKLNGMMSDNDDGQNDHDEDNDDDDDDDDDDDEIIKKPLFPSEFENTSSISSSNGISGGGMASFSQCSLSGTTSSTSQLQNPYHQHHSSSYHMLPQAQGKPPAPLPPQITPHQEQSHLGQDQHSHAHLHNHAVNRQMLSQVQDNIYSLNGGDHLSLMQNATYANGATATNGPPSVMNQQHNHRSDYHTLPPIVSDNVYNDHQQHNQLQAGLMHHNNTSATVQMGNTNGANNRAPSNNDPSNSNNGSSSSSSNNNSASNNNVIDLTRNHDARGSAFQIYSDMNQNNYHYYNIKKIS